MVSGETHLRELSSQSNIIYLGVVCAEICRKVEGKVMHRGERHHLVAQKVCVINSNQRHTLVLY